MPLVYREDKGAPLTNAELDGNFKELAGGKADEELVMAVAEIVGTLQTDKVDVSAKATSVDIQLGTTGRWVDAAGLKTAGITAAAIGTIDGKNGGYLNDDQYIRLRNVRTVSNGHAYTPAFRVTYRDLETTRFVQLFGDETVGTGFGAVLGVQLASGSGFNYAFSSTGVAYAANWSTSSDRRIKTEVEQIKNPLEAIQKLNGCTFLKNGLPSAGLIAQDVQEVLPQAVTSSGDFKLKDGTTVKDCLSVDYAALACLYVEAIKELAAKVEKLEAQIK